MKYSENKTEVDVVDDYQTYPALGGLALPNNYHGSIVDKKERDSKDSV